MAILSKTVNLDAMIPREDFAVQADIKGDTGNIDRIRLSDLDQKLSHLLSSLRKPDFQRETNHWQPEQVVSLIESFMDGDLIPSVILWGSESSYTFVIDGGHRLSALRAWVEDDYGDKTLSRHFFDHKITKAQIKAAERTRKIVDDRVGSFSEWEKKSKLDPKTLKLDEKSAYRLKRFATGAIPIQWIVGDVDKAESSFYKINQQGTPLDDIEELLIKNRMKPIPIAARAIIRSGAGNKYWSRFSEGNISSIEAKADQLFNMLFQPEYDAPVKTLDLPLGGNSGVRNALSLLIDLILIAQRNQEGKPRSVAEQPDDETGEHTNIVLDRTFMLVQSMTGNEGGSLGLHPAVYFYTATGKFSPSMFMGVATLISQKKANNDKSFFAKFIAAREQLEDLLIKKRSLFAVINNQVRSQKRYTNLAGLLDYLIAEINKGNLPSDSDLIEKAGLKESVLVPKIEAKSEKFSKETKSAVMIKASLAAAIKCPVCKGFLDAGKSVSFDHITPLKAGGDSFEDNCQPTHPYCNQSVKH
jgi:hypothetical protein